MAKLDGVLGIYAAHGRLAIAMTKGKSVKTAWVDIPSNIVQDGEVLSKNLFAQFLKDTIKENKFKSKKAAFVLSSDHVLMRNIFMPKMTEDQIRNNIPFEFRDFIKGELKEYLFDYAWRPGSDAASGEDADERIELTAAAIPVEHFNNLTEILQLSGLKIVKAVPDLCVIENLLTLFDNEEDRLKERCFLDIGNRNTRMQIYKDGKYKLSHLIDIGETYIVQTIADVKNVDMELARTYMRTNYEDCLLLPEVVNSYKDISLEIMKGFNYYEMSDMSSRLNDVVLYGSGAMIEPLVDLLKERLGKQVSTMSELFPQFNPNGDLNITTDAIGILFY